MSLIAGASRDMSLRPQNTSIPGHYLWSFLIKKQNGVMVAVFEMTTPLCTHIVILLHTTGDQTAHCIFNDGLER